LLSSRPLARSRYRGAGAATRRPSSLHPEGLFRRVGSAGLPPGQQRARGKEMGTMWRTRILAVAVSLLTCAGAGAETASSKELSENSVKVLMEYAWKILPAKFTTPEGKV